MADEPLPAEAEKLTLLQRVLRIPQTVRGLPAAALREFEVLQQMLLDRQVRLPLSRVELGILRNCYFLGGSVLHDMGQYENSIQDYSTATNRYQQRPTSIEAFVQISSCYRRLNRPLEARRAVEQAKVVLTELTTGRTSTERHATLTRNGKDSWTGSAYYEPASSAGHQTIG